jgi:hypothetical protein
MKYQIQLFDDKIIITEIKKERTIILEDIVDIASKMKRYKKSGFNLITKDKQKYYISADIKGCELILDQLLLSGNPELNPEKILDLKVQIAEKYYLSSQSVIGIVEVNLAFTIFLYFVLPACLLLFYLEDQFQSQIIGNKAYFIIESLLKLYLVVITFKGVKDGIIRNKILKIIKQKIMKIPNISISNLKYDHKFSSKSMIISFLGVVVVCMGFFKYDLNRLSFVRSGENITHLDLKRAEFKWVDKRYNCFNCAYSLVKDDIILYKNNGFETLARVVAFPSETTYINIKTEGRFVAAQVEKVIIPQNKVAVRVNRDGSVIKLIEISNIQGRLSDLSDFMINNKN